MFNLPSFRLRRQKEQPIKFVTLAEAFTPQIRVRATRDINGWVDRRRRVKWHIGAGSIGCLDEPTAREFATKGYVEILDGQIRPVSEDEAAYFLSNVKTINLGGNNG